MTKVLVVQGAGMNMRGKAQLKIFGPATLDQINDEIRAYAKNLDIEVEFFHSNIMGEVLNALYNAHDRTSTRRSSTLQGTLHLPAHCPTQSAK